MNRENLKIAARALFAVWLSVLFVSCTEKPAEATALYWVEREPGGEPYRTRLVVTAKFLRLDEDNEGNDFLLFDRVQQTIYSVSREGKSVLIIKSEAGPVKAPADLAHKVETDTTAFPAVAGKKITHYRLLTNGQRCYDLHAAEGLLPEVVTALREYYLTLAGQQALTLTVMPKAMQTPCDLANNVYLPARHLEYGLPVRLTDMNGKTSELMDFRTDFKAGERLFTLPVDYRWLSINELRGESEKK
jgi:hypothetical protein